MTLINTTKQFSSSEFVAGSPKTAKLAAAGYCLDFKNSLRKAITVVCAS